MKALAEFAMRGRFQSLLVAVLGAGSTLFCWVSASIIALMTLRRGVSQGFGLLAWAILPAAVLLQVYGQGGPLVLLIATTLMATVLRVTVSLSLAMLTAVPLAVLTGLCILLFGQHMLAEISGFFDQFLTNLEQQVAASGGAGTLPRPSAVQIAGLLGAVTAALASACLLLARWWQAVLYNPGGFAGEFRTLRYPRVLVAVLALTALALLGLGREYVNWAAICLVPLNFVGIALVHAWVASRSGGTGWLVGFYMLWLIFDPVKLLVVCLAIVDSWLNFRQRWGQPRP